MQDHLEGGPVGGVVCPAVLHQLGVARWCTALVGQGGALATQHRLLDGVHELVVVEGLLEGPQLPEHDAVGVDVGGEVVALLGEHLGGGPHRIVDHTALHRAAEHGFATEAKVGDLGHHLAVLVALEQHVGALEVAVNEGRVVVVQVGGAAGHIERDLETHGPVEAVGRIVQVVVQVAVGQVLGDQADGRDAEALQRDDVRMVEAAHQPHLATELPKGLAPRVLRLRLAGRQLDALDGHHLVAVAALVDHAVAALADAAVAAQLAKVQQRAGHLAHGDVGHERVDADRTLAVAQHEGLARDGGVLADRQREHERLQRVVLHAVHAGHVDLGLDLEEVLREALQCLDHDAQVVGLVAAQPDQDGLARVLQLDEDLLAAASEDDTVAPENGRTRRHVQQLDQEAREESGRHKVEHVVATQRGLAVGRLLRELGLYALVRTAGRQQARDKAAASHPRIVLRVLDHAGQHVDDLELLQQLEQGAVQLARELGRPPDLPQRRVVQDAVAHERVLGGDDGAHHVREPLRIEDDEVAQAIRVKVHQRAEVVQ
mmetsp:Transcript_12188/g.30891  ORF Transcript_12188/g.30891 Transcript_12188/m.30891 type:complete len:545 (-) Transcript_12188:613-2247(-)